MGKAQDEQLLGCDGPSEGDVETLLPPEGQARRAATGGRRAAGITAAGLLALGLLALAAAGRGRQAPAAAGAAVEAEVVLSASKAKAKECAAPAKNCFESQCCKAAGTQCYHKSGKWALCRPSCTPGRDPSDWDPGHWKCKALGERAPGHYQPPAQPVAVAPWVKNKCTGPGHNCMKTGCCTQPGHACYVKNKKWALCRAACVPGGPDPTDADSKPWNCTRLGMRTPGTASWPTKTAKWVKQRCSKNGEDCSETRCCRDAGMQCFKKNDQKARCLVGCNHGVHPDDTNNHPWNCTALGGRTPGMPPPPHQVKPGQWMAKKCSQNESVSCQSTQCCRKGGQQCYESSEGGWASCMTSCTEWSRDQLPGKKIDAKTKKPWTCKKLGPRTPRAWGTPSLFCFSVFRLFSYEGDLMRNQLWRGVGIFGCDLYAVFSSDWGANLGDGPLGELETIHFHPEPVGTSKDGTAANTALFMNVWEAVRWDGKYRATDWTIKADPDAVLIPDRLRWHLKSHVGHPAFILTCDKGMADGPMMFGSVEAISVQALEAYFNSESTCRNMPWGAWGEDLWMGNCLKALGVSAEGDPGMVSDGVCLFKNCAGGAAAFHPLKSLGEWMQCYWAAQR